MTSNTDLLKDGKTTKIERFVSEELFEFWEKTKRKTDTIPLTWSFGISGGNVATISTFSNTNFNGWAAFDMSDWDENRQRRQQKQ